MDKYQKEFVNNLKYYRKKKGLSQAQLAEACDVATGTIGNIECGVAKPSFDLIVRISEVLEIHPALFFAPDEFLATVNREKNKEKIMEDINAFAAEINNLAKNLKALSKKYLDELR